MSELDLILFIIANTAWAIIAIAQAQIIKSQKEMEPLNDNLIRAQQKAIEAYKKSVSVKDEYIELLEKALEEKNERHHTKMGKGITLTKAEAMSLLLALQEELK